MLPAQSYVPLIAYGPPPPISTDPVIVPSAWKLSSASSEYTAVLTLVAVPVQRPLAGTMHAAPAGATETATSDPAIKSAAMKPPRARHALLVMLSPCPCRSVLSTGPHPCHEVVH